jgi:hypothetical protein
MYFKHPGVLPVSGILICLSLVFLSASVLRDDSIHQFAQRVLSRLNKIHHPEFELLKIRKCELLLSDEGFLRYRKTYISGKQEYYSLNITRISSVDYLGDTGSGNLVLKTIEDDVIVQTFNDRDGNVDSMATYFRLDLYALEPEDLLALQDDIFGMKNLLKKN